jgi:hypothetical protein
MSRTILIFALITAGASVATGCEPGGAKSATVGSTNGIVGEDATADAGEGTDIAIAEETVGMSDGEAENGKPPLEVLWVDSADLAAEPTLSFEVTNASNVEQTFSAAVFSASPLGEAEKELGEKTLSPGEIADFSVSSSDLPVRSSQVVSRVFVKLTRSVFFHGEPKAVSELTASRNVLHEAGFGKAKAFTDEAFLEQLDGVRFAMPAKSGKLGGASTSDALGEVADSSGVFQAIDISDSAFSIRNEKGESLGTVTSMQVGRGDIGGMVFVPTATSDEDVVDGTEVESE